MSRAANTPSTPVSSWDYQYYEGVSSFAAASDWVTLPSVVANDQKFVGSYAVFSTGSNFIAFTAAGNYTVNWGDGSAPENFTSGAVATHNYTFSDVPSNTLTSEGFRQAIVTVTPQSGQNFTALNLCVKHTRTGLKDGYSTGWLQIKLSGPHMTSLNISMNTPLVRHINLESCKIIGPNQITSFAGMFAYCSRLQDVVIDDTSDVTSFNGAFSYCSALKKIPSINTSNSTDCSSMFISCFTLQEVPKLDTRNCTNFASMFEICLSLTSIPKFDTSKGTNFNKMFFRCNRISEFPLFDLGQGQNFTSMFSSCSKVREFPEFNTSSGTIFESMFSGCHSLVKPPSLDTSNGTNFARMFYSCSSIQQIPEYDVSNGTTFELMFWGNYALKYVPPMDTGNGLIFTGMFSNCYSLAVAPPIDTSMATAVDDMFLICYSLLAVPQLNTGTVTNFNRMFYGCSSIATIPTIDITNATTSTEMFRDCSSLRKKVVTSGLTKNISYANTMLSQASVESILTDLGSAASTIILTGVYGLGKVALSGTSTAGSATVTMASTTGLETGMEVTGTGYDTTRAVTFQDSGDTVTLAAHGLSNGKKVSFSAITNTTGIGIRTPYFVVNASTNTFQVAATEGGTPLTLTTDGTGSLVVVPTITGISENTSITLDAPVSASGTNTVTATKAKRSIAIHKGWAVTT